MFFTPQKKLITLSVTLLTVFFTTFIFASETYAEEIVVEAKATKFGVIRGVVRNKKGKAISQATVAIFRVGTSKLLKQVTATKSGKFFARIIPGTYTVLAVAQGYNPVTLKTVKVKRAAQLNYGFKLERAGSGNTLPEKRTDRSNSKWRIRAAQARRSIYQNQEGDKPIVAEEEIKFDAVAINNAGVNQGEKPFTKERKEKNTRKTQTAVETYVASNNKQSYAGINFATLKPIGKNAEVVIAGQVGTGQNAPKRFETGVNFRPNRKHQIQLKGSLAELGEIKLDQKTENLGQVSFQALDQWKIRESVVVVLGVDYSRFVGAGDDFSVSPRLGFQYDLDSKTRVRTSYTSMNDSRSWQKAIELEGTQVLFREPVSIEDIAIEDEKPQMNKSSRLEFGVERVLDNRSTIEANVFFDTVVGRGVGLVNLPFDSVSNNGFNTFVGNQQGKTQGLRVVYNRRFSSLISGSAGYAFGTGQKLSDKAITNPANVFEQDLFQSVFGQIDADFKTGTNIRTIFRFSPQATVFAIDPFQGRLAIYDPSLSVLVTQNLPSWGLPIDAEAIIDARNLFDFQNGVTGEDGSLIVNSQRRVLRGGILVRF